MNVTSFFFFDSFTPLSILSARKFSTMLFKFASLVLLQICVALLFPSAAAGQRDESHIGINSNGFDRLDRVATPYWTAIHQLTGVQTLHELGYTGKGIVIAILDEDFEFDSTTTNPDASVYQTQASLCSGKENQVKEFLSFVTESKGMYFFVLHGQMPARTFEGNRANRTV